MSIKTCVSLYSLQDEYLNHRMDLAECMRYVKQCGAEGVEILPDQMIKGTPHPSEAELQKWHAAVAETGLKPVIADVFLNTNLYKIIGLMISNGIVALSSAMYSHYQGFVDVNMGRGAIVIGLAAIIISNVVFGKLFTNFAAKLIAVAIGAVLYYIVIQVVLWLGLDTNLLKLLSALVVAMFLALPYWKGQIHLKKGGHTHA